MYFCKLNAYYRSETWIVLRRTLNKMGNGTLYGPSAFQGSCSRNFLCLQMISFEFLRGASIGWTVSRGKHLVHTTRPGARDWLAANFPRPNYHTMSKIQKNWCTVTVAPTIEHHGGHSRTPVNQRWDQVPGRRSRYDTSTSRELNSPNCSNLLPMVYEFEYFFVLTQWIHIHIYI